jgi:hypothetical protein
VCLLVWGCNADRRRSEPIASVQLQQARPAASLDANVAPPATPAPARRRPPALQPGPEGLPPRANEEFEHTLLGDVQEALSAVDENAFATLVRAEGPRGPERKYKHQRPDNCRNWRSLRTRGYAPKNPMAAQVDSGALVRCGALEFLARAQPSRVSYVRDVLAGAGPSTLPAIVASATSKLAQRSRSVAAGKGLTLAEFLPGARTGQSDLPGRVSIDEPASATSVILNAEVWGDVNSDDVEDVLLSVLNSSDDGTYFDMRLIEVTRTAPGALLTVLAVSQ